MFDYFLKDHLGNTRVVLTDEQQVDPYPVASLETNSLTNEQLYYTIPDAAGVRVEKAAVPGYPTDNYTDPNQFVHKLNGNGTKVGTSMVLKVMQGDSVRVRANSWYRLNGVTPDQPANPLEELIAALAGGISRMSSVKFSYTELVQSGVLSPGMTELLNTQSYTSTKPKAYLNWALFDEHFQLVGSSSGFDQVGSDDEFKTHFLPGIPITKNGYLYIYVSNETPNVDVFFDNVQVTHVRGPLLEETHYYPFGLTMAGISSKAAGKLENKNDKFQGQPLDDDLGVNWYGFKWRNHDPQIGRFIQVDPLADEYEYNSTYAFSENKVTAHIELEGLEAVPLSSFWAAVKNEFQNAASWFDRTFSGTLKTSVSTEVSSRTAGNVTTSNSVNVTSNSDVTTNLGGKMSFLLNNNTLAGNNEPLVKTTTTTTVSAEQKTEVKTGNSTVTNKTSVDNNGVVTTETGGKTSVNLRGLKVTLSGNASQSTDGKKKTTVQVSTSDNTKAKASATYSTTGNKKTIEISAGGETKAGKVTTSTTVGLKINL